MKKRVWILSQMLLLLLLLCGCGNRNKVEIKTPGDISLPSAETIAVTERDVDIFFCNASWMKGFVSTDRVYAPDEKAQIRFEEADHPYDMIHDLEQGTEFHCTLSDAMNAKTTELYYRAVNLNHNSAKEDEEAAPEKQELVWETEQNEKRLGLSIQLSKIHADAESEEDEAETEEPAERHIVYHVENGYGKADSAISLQLGSWESPEKFAKNYVPQTLRLEFNGISEEVSFAREQTRYWILFAEPVETAEFKFSVLAAYLGTETDDVCIAEVGFYSDEIIKGDAAK